MARRRKRKPTKPARSLLDCKNRYNKKRRDKKQALTEEAQKVKVAGITEKNSVLLQTCIRHGWVIPNIAKQGSEATKILRVLEAWQFAMRKYFWPNFKLRKIYFQIDGKYWVHMKRIAVACEAAKVKPRFYLSVLFRRYKRWRRKAPPAQLCYQEKAFVMVVRAHREADKYGIGIEMSMPGEKQEEKHWEDYQSVERFLKRNQKDFDSFEEALLYLYKRGKVSLSFYELYFPTKG